MNLLDYDLAKVVIPEFVAQQFKSVDAATELKVMAQEEDDDEPTYYCYRDFKAYQKHVWASPPGLIFPKVQRDGFPDNHEPSNILVWEETDAEDEYPDDYSYWANPEDEDS